MNVIVIILRHIFWTLNVIQIGIFVEIIVLLFQLVTLLVEINTSKIALKGLNYSLMIDSKELKIETPC